MKSVYKFAFSLPVALASACGMTGDSQAYTLYRNSMVAGVERLHVATFDASDGEAYNRENCQLAAKLLQEQPGVETKFWCEKGRFRK